MENGLLFADNLQQEFVILLECQVKGALLNLGERSISLMDVSVVHIVFYLSGSERTKHDFDLCIFVVVVVLFFLFFVIRGDFDGAYVRELHRGTASGVRKLCTKSGVGDDQIALGHDRDGLTGLYHGTPGIYITVERVYAQRRLVY
jgi:hypothetical protein